MASTLNYTTYVSQLANLTVISSNDASFQTMLPGAIDYAEQRIYREGDFLSTYVYDIGNFGTNDATLTYPTNFGTYLVVDQVFVSTSISTAGYASKYTPLSVVSQPYIANLYPGALTDVGFPKYFCQATNTYGLVGPVPDQAYSFYVYGTQRPLALSAANSSTFLTQTLPDLLIAASMVFISGYMRNFGSQADDAPMATSWSKQYDILFASAGMEEQRKKFGSQGWQSQVPNPIATPTRV